VLELARAGRRRPVRRDSRTAHRRGCGGRRRRWQGGRRAGGRRI